MTRTFEGLLAEAEAADVEGWGFSWLTGRATEERAPWGYTRLVADRVRHATALLDLETGGGEVLAEIPGLPATTWATEYWPPNLAIARRRLEPAGITVVDGDPTRLPFDDSSFDLVISRHPVAPPWAEAARVLRPGGTLLCQGIGPNSMIELAEVVAGPRPPGTRPDPEQTAEIVRQTGLIVTDLRTAALRAEFYDIGAVVYFLRKVIWTVPDFSVAKYRTALAALHARLRTDGPFVAHAQRFLLEARRPD
ncbi:SAM-dependent methyltransferase [Actinoalloteichus hoggarensis]|uniref:Phthiotriol/phenolphthiotriol dimycocerosates methyltransferase n=1 Tax=Actinoalloteichus hoggarensis TaxID=1470176 RepID=A0A221W412_9PSEU|nr:class I SAM-dependent methyltransferase [Actinoalloteichus hoggarensis]ASO20399.1 Phthiotriol/phenolphthiotriol dimycocerosates methyltransferase [Actinoalloteichus hoggarensis]MBB5923438.1 SAM-dependent methyltransferase [Actinoalloteichus hoggarensis]